MTTPTLGHAAFHPHANGPIWPADPISIPGHSLRTIICTDEEFTAVCRYLAERRAASAGRQLPVPAPAVYDSAREQDGGVDI